MPPRMCGNCHARNDADARFCKRCGARCDLAPTLRLVRAALVGFAASLIVAASFFTIPGATTSAPTSAGEVGPIGPQSVAYQVTSSFPGATANLRYRAPTGEMVDLADVALPWGTTAEAGPGAFLMLSAELKTGTGEITSSISIAGAPAAKITATGRGVIAHANAWVPGAAEP